MFVCRIEQKRRRKNEANKCVGTMTDFFFCGSSIPVYNEKQQEKREGKKKSSLVMAQ